MSAQWLSSMSESYSSAAQALFKLVGSVDLDTAVLQKISSINWALAVRYCSNWAYKAGDIIAFMRKVCLEMEDSPL